MLDLFGDNITSPTVACKSVLNAAHGFPEWWATLPSHPRKTGKQQALNAWAKLECAENATLIRMYTNWLKTQDDWLKGFMPLPTTLLRRQGWIDWEPIEVKAKPERDPELEKIDNDTKMAVKPSAEILAKLAAIRMKVKA